MPVNTEARITATSVANSQTIIAMVVTMKFLTARIIRVLQDIPIAPSLIRRQRGVNSQLSYARKCPLFRQRPIIFDVTRVRPAVVRTGRAIAQSKAHARRGNPARQRLVWAPGQFL